MQQTLFYPLLVFGLGIVSFLWVLPDWHVLLDCCLFLSCCTYLFTSQRKLLILLLAFFIGFTWSSWQADLRLAQRIPVNLESTPVSLIGKVDGFASPTKWGSSVRLQVESINDLAIKPQKLVLLSDYRKRDWPPNSRWQLSATLKRPLSTMNNSGFDREAWCWYEGISALGSIRKERVELSTAKTSLSEIDKLRAKLLQRIERVGQKRPRAAAIVAALTIGVKNRIQQKDWDLFRAAGIVHLVSISGLHITLLAAWVSFFVALLLRITKFTLVSPRLIIALSALVSALCYALLSGWSVPTQRALYMLFFVVFMLLWRRSIPAFRVWWIALSAVLVIDPFAVLSPGLWLSFCLVAALILASFGRRQSAKKLLSIWQAQWAISVVSVVLLCIFFAALPLASPLINALAIPLVSILLTPLSLISLLCPWDGLLQITIWLTEQSLHGLDFISRLAIVFHPAVAPKIFYLLATCGALWLIAPRGVPARIAGALLICPLLLYKPPQPKIGSFFVHMIDVGQGLSVFVQTEKHSLLFDTGFGDAKRLLLPYLYGFGINHLDEVIVSHHDSDHDGALPSLLENISVAKVLAGQADLERKRNLKQDVRSCQQGQHWVWDGVSFDILAPSKTWYANNDNEASCVLRISNKKTSFLLTGDLPARGEQKLVADYGKLLRSNILSAGHHGSKSASSVEFLDNVEPDEVWISAGYHNRYHLPNTQVLNRLNARKIKIWRTDLQGAIQVKSDYGVHKTQAKRDGYMEFWRVNPLPEP